MTLIWTQSPDADLPYAIDWSTWLPLGDTLASSNWIVPVGITGHSASFTSTLGIIWVMGGTPGETYTLINSIATAGNLKESRSLIVIIQQR